MANVPNTGAGIGNQTVHDLAWLFTSNVAPALSASLINTATKQVAEIGYVVWSDGGTHNISKIGHYYAANTTGTATFRVSLQDVSAAAVFQPDGVVDQSWTSATPPASNAWTEVTLSAVRSSVATGTLLAVVWNFSAFTSASVFRPSYLPQAGGAVRRATQENVTNYDIDSAGAWIINGGVGAHTGVVFVSDDATPVYGTFENSCIAKAFNTHAFNNTSNPKVHALSYTPVRNETLIAVEFPALTAAGNAADFDVVVYSNAGAVLASVPIDATQLAIAAGTRAWYRAVLNYNLVKDTNYRIGIRPTTANNVTCYSYDIHDANYRSVLKGGTQLAYTTLSSGDVWAADMTTRILQMTLLVSADDPAAAAGGFSPLITELS